MAAAAGRSGESVGAARRKDLDEKLQYRPKQIMREYVNQAREISRETSR